MFKSWYAFSATQIASLDLVLVGRLISPKSRNTLFLLEYPPKICYWGETAIFNRFLQYFSKEKLAANSVIIRTMCLISMMMFCVADSCMVEMISSMWEFLSTHLFIAPYCLWNAKRRLPCHVTTICCEPHSLLRPWHLRSGSAQLGTCAPSRRSAPWQTWMTCAGMLKTSHLTTRKGSSFSCLRLQQGIGISI